SDRLLPALVFVNVYPMLFSFVADHFQYLASAALFALVAALATTWWTRLGNQQRSLAATFAAGVLIILGVLAFRQARVYRNLETLWTDTLAKNPDCWMAHYNLGLEYGQSGRMGEALPHFERSVSLRPTADAHNQLGIALDAHNRFAEAAEHLRTALRL